MSEQSRGDNIKNIYDENERRRKWLERIKGQGVERLIGFLALLNGKEIKKIDWHGEDDRHSILELTTADGLSLSMTISDYGEDGVFFNFKGQDKDGSLQEGKFMESIGRSW